MHTLLVTGGAGFIGSTFAKLALNLGYSVTILDNLSTGSRENADKLEGLGATIVIGDLRDFNLVSSLLKGIDAVIHLGAQVSVPVSVENPTETEEINVMGTQNVIDSCILNGVNRLIVASSAAVYGENENFPLNEDAGGMVLSPYAESKWENEKQILESRIKGLNSVALRFFNVYGVGQRPDSAYAAVIPKFVDMMVQGNSPRVNGDGLQTRDFVHVSDVCEAIFKFLDHEWKGEKDHVFNVATQTRLSLIDLIDEINVSLKTVNPAHVEIPPTYGPERIGDIRHSMANNSRLIDATGWEPKIEFSDGIFELVKEAYLSNGN